MRARLEAVSSGVVFLVLLDLVDLLGVVAGAFLAGERADLLFVGLTIFFNKN